MILYWLLKLLNFLLNNPSEVCELKVPWDLRFFPNLLIIEISPMNMLDAIRSHLISDALGSSTHSVFNSIRAVKAFNDVLFAGHNCIWEIGQDQMKLLKFSFKNLFDLISVVIF